MGRKLTRAISEGMVRPALCPKCGHEVRSHQPSSGVKVRDQSYVGCQECGCIITMYAKLKAWGGRRK